MAEKMKFCRDVNENPCNMCMPMGGIIALKGIAGSMVILHGSQGCSTYMRRHIAEHFNEPIDVGSSSLNEKGTIYGGEKNLEQALDNVRKVYQPQMIGILTTCLAETIGEDVDRFAGEYQRKNGLEDFPLVTAPTPGYGLSHDEGYWFTARRILTCLTKPADGHNKVNIIVPNISPADIREIKRILELTGIEYTLFPDISDALDRPFERPYTKVTGKGTLVDEIKAMSGAVATLQMGVTVEDAFSPGQYLQDTFGVPLYNVPLPIGLTNMDRFMTALQEITGKSVPDSLLQERGRLLDGMIDSHKYNFQGRGIIFGDPELVYALTTACLENGVHPVVAATGSRSERLAKLLNLSLPDGSEPLQILTETDFDRIRQWSEEGGANVAIGHSGGRYLEEQAGIPLIRIGFPILDRVGGQRILSVGYGGTMQFLDRVTNTLLEHKHKTYRKKMYEQFYCAAN